MLHNWDLINRARNRVLSKEVNEKKQIDIPDNITDEEKYKLDCQNAKDDTDHKCPECLTGNVISNKKSGYNECDNCEYTDDIIITDEPEWRKYDTNSEHKVRCGAAINPNLPKSSMSTLISGRGFGNIKRIQKWNSMPHHERSLNEAFKQMEKQMSKINILGMVKEDAKYYYKIIHDKDDNYVLTRGKNRQAVIAACCLYACNQREVARPDVEIADLFGIELKDMTKGCNKFREIMWAKGHKIYFDPVSPLLYVERFCNIAGIKDEHMEIGKFIAYRVYKLNILSTNTPLSVSGGIVYFLSLIYNYKLDRKKLKSICKTGNATIDICCKKMKMYRNHILPKKIRDEIKWNEVKIK